MCLSTPTPTSLVIEKLRDCGANWTSVYFIEVLMIHILKFSVRASFSFFKSYILIDRVLIDRVLIDRVLIDRVFRL